MDFEGSSELSDRLSLRHKTPRKVLFPQDNFQINSEAKLVCDVLVVWKLDRVSRRLLDGL
jgi:hypothetical protein